MNILIYSDEICIGAIKGHTKGPIKYCFMISKVMLHKRNESLSAKIRISYSAFN
jgi:hypothetical protein